MQETVRVAADTATRESRAADKETAEVEHTRTFRKYPSNSPLNSQKASAVCTRRGRGTDGGDSGVSSGAHHISAPIPAVTTGPGNEPISPNIAEKDLVHRVDDSEQS